MQSLDTDELMRRATGLLALGNTPARVRAALHSMGASPEQVDEVMAAIEARTHQKYKTDARYLWWLGGATGVVMGTLMCVALAGLWQPKSVNSPVQTNQTLATKPAGQSISSPQPALPIQTILTQIPFDVLPRQLPTEVAPDFMAATPVVIRGGGLAATPQACPNNEFVAARVFGGDASNWTYDNQSSGWTMTNVGAGVTIDVPEHMVAGYMTMVESIQMVRVEGPVTIENVNFIAISCP
jgi:hypothetical protein